MITFDTLRLQEALQQAAATLSHSRPPAAPWPGQLPSSPTAVAAATAALFLADTEWKSAEDTLRRLGHQGLEWLAHHVNGDGGWGDTPRSFSNLGATALAWAAFGLAPPQDHLFADTVQAAERWICQKAGNTAPAILVPMIRNHFRGDLALAAGVLMTCALAGRLGSDIRAWRHVPALPFERGAVPPEWWSTAHLPGASWAMSLLLAAGQARHHNLADGCFATRLARECFRASTLRRLEALQAEDGSFQASPWLTALTTIGLLAAGYGRHPVTEKGIRYLVAQARPDGSWPIVANHEVWLTAQAVQVSTAPALGAHRLPALNELNILRRWLLARQQREDAEGLRQPTAGWPATSHPGADPDTLSTAESLLALRALGDPGPEVIQAVLSGVNWLLAAQNRDGGLPPFRRGWRQPAREHSGAEETALALRAWLAWLHVLPPDQQHRVQSSVHHAIHFLMEEQRQDGAWFSRHFGNQYAHQEENLTLGTAGVLLALPELVARSYFELVEPLNSGVLWLVKNQNSDGSWGGGHGGPPSVEETSLAVEALAEALLQPGPLLLETREQVRNAAAWGANWLVQQVEGGKWTIPAPLGLQWGQFWYYEDLWPALGVTRALAKMTRLV
jgi:squalene-hopene/tetraprenyl-beta-curcumene cyclase